MNAESNQSSIPSMESGITTHQKKNRKYLEIYYSENSAIIHLNYSLHPNYYDDTIIVTQIESDGNMDINFLTRILEDSINQIPKHIAYIRLETLDPKTQEIYKNIGERLKIKGKIKDIGVYGDREGVSYQIKESNKTADQITQINRISMQLCTAHT